jgi:hypothetical protein
MPRKGVCHAHVGLETQPSCVLAIFFSLWLLRSQKYGDPCVELRATVGGLDPCVCRVVARRERQAGGKKELDLGLAPGVDCCCSIILVRRKFVAAMQLNNVTLFFFFLDVEARLFFC